MGIPEDVAAEKYFTSPTLTEMLVNADTFFYPDQLIAVKEVFKEWLRTVGLPTQMSEESTRQLLITLVDEP